MPKSATYWTADGRKRTIDILHWLDDAICYATRAGTGAFYHVTDRAVLLLDEKWPTHMGYTFSID